MFSPRPKKPGSSKFCQANGGFTLVELLVVIGIIAVLSTVTILIINPAEHLRASRDAARLDNLSTLNRSLSLFQVDTGGGQAP